MLEARTDGAVLDRPKIGEALRVPAGAPDRRGGVAVRCGAGDGDASKWRKILIGLGVSVCC
jgi:hypothetical protein